MPSLAISCAGECTKGGQPGRPPRAFRSVLSIERGRDVVDTLWPVDDVRLASWKAARSKTLNQTST